MPGLIDPVPPSQLEQYRMINIQKSLHKYKDAVAASALATRNAALEANKFGYQLNQVGFGAARGAITMENFGAYTSQAIKKVIVWQLAIMAVYSGIRKFSEVVEVWKDLEVTLARISITTGKLGDELYDYFNKVATVAIKFGMPIEQTLRGMDLALRATASLAAEEDKRIKVATNLLEATSVLVNITGMQYPKAIDILVGSLRQTNLEMDQGLVLLNKWVEVAKNAAVSVDDMSQGFATMADAGTAAGLSVDQMNGIIAALSETVTLGSVQTANAIRAIMSTVYNPGAIDMMQKVGVSVRDAEGEIRNFWDVMSQLSAMKLSGVLEESTWLEIAKAAGAGQRRYAQFLALLNNWSTAIRIEGISAMSDQNAAMEANAKIVDTLTNVWDKFTAAQRKLWFGLGDQGGVISDFTSVLQTLTNVIERLSNVSGGLYDFGKAVLYLAGTFGTLALASKAFMWLGLNLKIGSALGRVGGVAGYRIAGTGAAERATKGLTLPQAEQLGVGAISPIMASQIGLLTAASLVPFIGTKITNLMASSGLAGVTPEGVSGRDLAWNKQAGRWTYARTPTNLATLIPRETPLPIQGTLEKPYIRAPMAVPYGGPPIMGPKVPYTPAPGYQLTQDPSTGRIIEGKSRVGTPTPKGLAGIPHVGGVPITPTTWRGVAGRSAAWATTPYIAGWGKEQRAISFGPKGEVIPGMARPRGVGRFIPSGGAMMGAAGIGLAAFTITKDKATAAGAGIAAGIGATLGGPIGMIAGSVIGGVIGRTFSNIFKSEADKASEMLEKFAKQFDISITDTTRKFIDEIRETFEGLTVPTSDAEWTEELRREAAPEVPIGIRDVVRAGGYWGQHGAIKAYKELEEFEEGWLSGTGAAIEALDVLLSKDMITQKDYNNLVKEGGVNWLNIGKEVEQYIIISARLNGYVEEGTEAWYNFTGALNEAGQNVINLYGSLAVLDRFIKQQEKINKLYIDPGATGLLEGLSLKEWESSEYNKLIENQLKLSDADFKNLLDIIPSVGYAYAAYAASIDSMNETWNTKLSKLSPQQWLEISEWDSAFVRQMTDDTTDYLDSLARLEEFKRTGGMHETVTKYLGVSDTELPSVENLTALHGKLLGILKDQSLGAEDLDKVKTYSEAVQSAIDDINAVQISGRLVQGLSERGQTWRWAGTTRVTSPEDYKKYMDFDVQGLLDTFATRLFEQNIPVGDREKYTFIDPINNLSRTFEGTDLTMQMLSEYLKENTKALEKGLEAEYNIPAGYAVPTSYMFYKATGSREIGERNFPTIANMFQEWASSNAGAIDKALQQESLNAWNSLSETERDLITSNQGLVTALSGLTSALDISLAHGIYQALKTIKEPKDYTDWEGVMPFLKGMTGMPGIQGSSFWGTEKIDAVNEATISTADTLRNLNSTTETSSSFLSDIKAGINHLIIKNLTTNTLLHNILIELSGDPIDITTQGDLAT